MCACVDELGFFLFFTSDLIQALSGNVIVLIDPFSITFEVDLGGRRRPTPQLDRPVLYDEGVLWFQQKFREGLRWGRREGIREDLRLAVVAALWKRTKGTDEIKTCQRWGDSRVIRCAADSAHLECVCECE